MTLSRRVLIALLACLLSTAAIATYPTEEAGAAASDEAPRTRPKNLQALPRDIAPVALGRLMKRYERDLGVRCGYCHVENHDTGKIDFVSDENAMKQKARVMIGMLDSINNDFMAQLGGDSRYAVPVSCGSCHQGRANPQPWEPAR